jgi:hypothetical protein
MAAPSSPPSGNRRRGWPPGEAQGTRYSAIARNTKCGFCEGVLPGRTRGDEHFLDAVETGSWGGSGRGGAVTRTPGLNDDARPRVRRADAVPLHERSVGPDVGAGIHRVERRRQPDFWIVYSATYSYFDFMAWKKWLAVGLLIAGSFLGSCGGGSGGNSGAAAACGPVLSGSCTDQNGLFCAEYARLSADASALLMAPCNQTSGHGTWSTRGCTHVGALGACKLLAQSGECVAQYFYVGTASDAQAVCSQLDGVWVNP